MALILGILLTASIALPVVAAPAQAQVLTDPEAGSPAGTIYELPFDRARSDAAPRPRTGGRAGTRGADPGVQRRSFLRSENNFGSSSTVPGVAATGVVGSEAGNGSGAGEAPPSGEGGGGRAEDPGPGVRAVAPEALGAGGSPPSTLAALFLLAVVGLGGLGVAVLARRAPDDA